MPAASRFPARIAALASTLALATWPGATIAQSTIEVRGEQRVRIEAITGQFRPGAAPSDVAILSRTSVFAEYATGPFTLGGEIIDSRVFAERDRSAIATTEVNAVEPVQAYLAVDLPAGGRVQAGRFTLNLGSRRLIARNAFRNSINIYTGVNAVVGEVETGRLTAFWMRAPTRLPDTADAIRANRIALDRERGSPFLLGAFAERRHAGAEINAYLIRLAENDQPGIATRDRHLWTIGGRMVVAPRAGAWDVDLEGAAQWGRGSASTRATPRDQQVTAGFVHASVGRTIDAVWRPRLRLAVDYASGDGRGDRLTRFDTLFGARSFDFGPTSLFGPVGRANLLSTELRGEARPDARTELYAAARPLWLASRTDAFSQTGVRDPTGRSGRWAGVQLDARVRRTLLPDRLRLALGVAALLKGRFLRAAPDAPRTGDTGYVYSELTATF